MFPGLMPGPFRLRQKCPRCGLLYPKSETACPHCSNLSDAEVEQLKSRVSAEGDSAATLGYVFLAIAALIAAALLLAL